MRQAIETSLREPVPAGQSLYDQVHDLIAALPVQPGPETDRSTNKKKWLKGYGLDNAQYREKFGGDRRPR